MDRKLLDYLPPVLREVMEIQAINNANEPEITLAWDALTLVLANQFLETADTRGVAVWERELNITPKDTDTLLDRKKTIKAKWGLELPYTLTWLRNWFDASCGPETYKIIISDYTIDIQLDYDVLPNNANLLETLWDLLETLLPANMILSIVPVSTSFMTAYAAAVPIGCEITDGAMAEYYSE